jgi:uncharacterized membrane protein
MKSLTKARIESIDLLKGLVMIIMALDHTRDYFHASAFLFNPSDPTQSTLPIFFTRFITHFCAPTFCFLAGVSAFMTGRRKTKGDLALFLIKRGLWLIFIELSLVTFAWQFDFQFRINGFAVIAMLGISMITLAGLIYVPRNALIILCSMVILGHNTLDNIHFPNNFLWANIHQQEVLTFSNGFKFYIDYPIIPWFAVMALGYCFGPYYDKYYDSNKRKKIFNTIGLLAVILFFGLRVSNIYGDQVRWTKFGNLDATIMSFFQVTKYPPSLLFLLITMGSMFLFLGNSEHLKGKIVSFFSTYGRVPFFYYIIHLYIIHLLAAVFAQLSGFGWLLLVLPDWILELPTVKGYGFSLVVVYIVWIVVIAITYPLCKWYDNYKTKHPDKWWLSYL